jgi:hypothetical protein
MSYPVGQNKFGLVTASQPASEQLIVYESIANKTGETTAQFSDRILAKVFSTGGRLVTCIKMLQFESKWLNEIQRMPVQRGVRLRHDALPNLTRINSREWFSHMIQAMGFQQPQRCTTCLQGQGPFDSCIVLGGSLFPNCGNCVWKRQLCEVGIKAEERTSLAYILHTRPLWDTSRPETTPSLLELEGLMTRDQIALSKEIRFIILERLQNKQWQHIREIGGEKLGGFGVKALYDTLKTLKQDHPILELLLPTADTRGRNREGTSSQSQPQPIRF